MIEIAKVIKYSILIMSISRFIFSECMIEDLDYGIYEGIIDSVEAGIDCGQDVNQEIYCKSINKSLKPLIFAIKCLNRVRDTETESLKRRLAIVKLLIKNGAKIDAKIDYIKLVKSKRAKLKLQKILDAAIRGKSGSAHPKSDDDDISSLSLENEFVDLFDANKSEDIITDEISEKKFCESDEHRLRCSPLYTLIENYEAS